MKSPSKTQLKKTDILHFSFILLLLSMWNRDVLELGDDFKVKDFSGVSNKMFEEENWRSKLFFYFHKSLFSGLKDLIIYMEYLWTCHKEAFLCFKWNCSVKSLVTLTWMSLKIALSSRKWSIKSPARLKTEMIGPLKMWLLNEILSVY